MKIDTINKLKEYIKNESIFFEDIFKNMANRDLSNIYIYCDNIEHINDFITSGKNYISEIYIGNNEYDENSDLGTFLMNIEKELKEYESLNLKIKTIDNSYVQLPIVYDPQKQFINSNIGVSILLCKFK